MKTQPTTAIDLGLDIKNLPSPTEIQLPAGVSILDIITYVASLASKPQEIDQLLDSVRELTARKQPSEFNEQDKRDLKEVYAKLEIYLIEKEPLRGFTRSSLRQAVYDYLQSKPSTSLRRPLTIMWVMIIVAITVPFLLPLPGSAPNLRLVLIVVFLQTVINSAAAWFFWTARHNFKEILSRVYRPIAAGTIPAIAALVQFPIVLLLNQPVVYLWFHYLTTSIPTLLFVTFFYIAIRRFAMLLAIKSSFMSTIFLVFAALGSALVVNLLPHTPYSAPSWMHVIGLTVRVSGAIVPLFTVFLIIRMRAVLNHAFQRPLLWLMGVMILFSVNFAQYALIQLTVQPGSIFETKGYTDIILFIAGFVGLRAGILFRRLDTSMTRRKAEQIRL